MHQQCPLPLMFDPNSVGILGGGSFIKESGKYPVILTSMKMTPTKSNQAIHFIEATLEITEGALKGQSFIDRLNINGSDAARKYAYAALSSYATAIGQQQAFSDANVLCNRPFQVYVQCEEKVSTIDPNKTNWENEVKKWYYADGEEITQGRYGSNNAQGTAPQGNYASPQAGVPTPQSAPAAPAGVPQGQGYAPPAGQGYAPPQGQAPQGQAPAAGQVTIDAGQGFVPQGQAPQGYAPPQGQVPQGQAPANGYAPPAGQAPAGYTPPAQPNFAAPQG